MGEYSLVAYAKMFAEEPRFLAYNKSLNKYVNSESIILDIGAGAGIFSIIAAKLGARKIVAVEPDPVINLAKELAQSNGVLDRIEFNNCKIEELNTSEKFDLIVTDLRGRLPFYRNNLEIINYSREKYLKTGGIILPGKDILYTALAASYDEYLDNIEPWHRNSMPFNNHVFQGYLSNLFYPANLISENMGSEGVRFAEIDYNKRNNLSHRYEIEYKVEKEDLYGFYVWFDSELVDDISYSNGPGSNNKIYGSAWFPFEKPLKAKIGSTIKVMLSADYIDGEYTWTWITHTPDSNGQYSQKFRQSTFLASVFNSEQLHNKIQK